jgi:predicted acylesterase/phospholipase RssA
VVRVARYCDIVMKGGITSGVVYPLAAVELAKGHRFRNIGGTSAGAIAAAAVAAAEYGKHSGRNPGAYDGISALPHWLGPNLTSLFQPSRRMRPFFNALLSSLGDGIPRKILAPVNGFPLAAIVGFLLGAAFISSPYLLDAGTGMRWVIWAVGLVVVLPALTIGSIAVSAIWRLRGLAASDFGLCSGSDPDGKAASTPPLTRWLADLLDELAGKRAGEPPLTFGDLDRLEQPDGSHGLNLQMMTSCLSMGRPFTLPFEDGEKLWFKPKELGRLFPQRIVNHMVATAPGPADEQGRVPLPRADDFPVVVATRMSLSFPVLIAAIPLHAENHIREDGPEIERCWFSDGGITSNFPVHFFDSPVPRWPTYAIDLTQLPPGEALSKDEAKNVWLPRDNEGGIAEAWIGWEEKGGFGRLFAFLSAIFRTAQNWIDNRQMRGPGYRDRIAHVRLTKKEGGMNLNMDGAAIERLAERGQSAAAQLSERFGPRPPEGTELTWANQRWLRYRAYMTLVEEQGLQALLGFEDTESGAQISALNARPLDAPPGYGWSSEAQKAFAIEATKALLDGFAEWEREGQTFAAGSPEPPVQPWQIPRV